MAQKSSLVALFAAAIVGFSCGASATEFPTKEFIPAATYNWTGCYGGVSGGAGMESDWWTGTTGSDLRGLGGLAGGQLGCNYQMGWLVAGIEGEGYWSSLRNSFSEYSGPTSFETWTTRNPYNFDVAARFGLAFDRAFFYGKGGVVFGRFDFANTGVGTAPPGAFAASGSATLPGLLLGLGLEYGLTPHWTAKMEYDFLGFSATTIGFTCVGAGCTTTAFNLSPGATEQVFKLGLNYKFDSLPGATR